MIAKITRGERVGDIAAYLHGPGKANEHQYKRGGQTHTGGVVIASNIGVEGDTEPNRWVKDLRATQKQRPDIKKPIWQASLRAAPGDRIMSDAEWSSIAVEFMRGMGLENRPWVAVRHGDDHIHVVATRVDDEGQVWHGRNDRRQAQTVCTQLEHEHKLTHAPRRRTGAKRTVSEQREMYRKAARGDLRQPDVLPGQISREDWESYDEDLQNTIRTAMPYRVPNYARTEREKSRSVAPSWGKPQQWQTRPQKRPYNAQQESQRGMER